MPNRLRLSDGIDKLKRTSRFGVHSGEVERQPLREIIHVSDAHSLFHHALPVSVVIVGPQACRDRFASVVLGKPAAQRMRGSIEQCVFAAHRLNYIACNLVDLSKDLYISL